MTSREALLFVALTSAVFYGGLALAYTVAPLCTRQPPTAPVMRLHNGAMPRPAALRDDDIPLLDRKFDAQEQFAHPR